MFYIHVNRGTIDSNRKNGTNDPPVKFQEGKYGKPTYCHELALPDGSVMAYDHEGRILPCGARLVVIAPTKPEVIR